MGKVRTLKGDWTCDPEKKNGVICISRKRRKTEKD